MEDRRRKRTLKRKAHQIEDGSASCGRARHLGPQPSLVTIGIQTRSKTSSTTSFPTQLCALCTRIDFSKVFQTRVNGHGKRLVDLGSFEDIQNRDRCEFCKFLVKVVLADALHPLLQGRKYHLRAVSMSAIFGRDNLKNRLDIRDKVALAIVPIYENFWSSQSMGYIGVVEDSKPNTQTNTQFGVRSIKPNTVDIPSLESWLVFCRAYHTKYCNFPNRGTIHSLKVIDCHRRTIVKAPKRCQYVALSYVWGPATDFVAPATEGNILKCIPNVIEDSMKLAQQLHFRYLWVDRYCIDQSNSQEKHEQIHNMDLIYAGAELTIIAACGQDPNFGLPGIGKRQRAHQPSVRMGNLFLASTLPRTSMWLAEKSIWATRAWTYQEAILSRRRLVFTDTQVAYDCNSMHCVESTVVPLEALHYKNKDHFKQNLIAFGVFQKQQESRPISGPHDMMEYVSQYSTKKLTYPHDKLNAVQGVFRNFSSRLNSNMYSLGGIVMSREEDTKMSFLRGLTWDHFAPGVRRQEFPSWSWTGWDSKVRAHLHAWRAWPPNPDIFLNLEEQDGTLHELPSCYEEVVSVASKIDNTLRFLNVRTWAFRPSFLDIEAVSYHGIRSLHCRAKLKLQSDRYVRVDIYRCESQDDPKAIEKLTHVASSTLAIALHYPGSGLYMLVEERASHLERVGLLEILGHLSYLKIGENHLEIAREEVDRELLAMMTRQSFRIG